MLGGLRPVLTTAWVIWCACSVQGVACQAVIHAATRVDVSSESLTAGRTGPGPAVAAHLDPFSPLLRSELVIAIVSSTARLAIVEASRPGRVGIRTVVAIEDASQALKLTTQHQQAYLETYVACADRTNTSLSLARRQGPRLALAPLLAHEALSAAQAHYKWLLLGQDDTLWRPLQALMLLKDFDASLPHMVSDHLQDFNGLRVLSPSHAPTACLPCHINMTHLMGKRKAPGMPWPACTSGCRPPIGCEHRWESCMGLAGGALCHSKRFLGSGDRCPPSWHAAGAGVALSRGLLASVKTGPYTECAVNITKSIGERVMARCMWRAGHTFTLPGLAVLMARRAFDDRFVAFDPPLPAARSMLLTGSMRSQIASGSSSRSNTIMTRQLQGLHTNDTQRHPMQVSPPWAARELLMDSRDATLSFSNHTRDGQGLVISRLAGLGSSRGQQQRAMGPLCGEACAAWAMSRAVSVHLRIPTNATAAEVHAGAQTMQITAVRLVPTGL